MWRNSNLNSRFYILEYKLHATYNLLETTYSELLKVVLSIPGNSGNTISNTIEQYNNEI